MKLPRVVEKMTLAFSAISSALAAWPTVSAAVMIRAMMRAILRYVIRCLDIPLPPEGFATASSRVQSFNPFIYTLFLRSNPEVVPRLGVCYPNLKNNEFLAKHREANYWSFTHGWRIRCFISIYHG